MLGFLVTTWRHKIPGQRHRGHAIAPKVERVRREASTHTYKCVGIIRRGSVLHPNDGCSGKQTQASYPTRAFRGATTCEGKRQHLHWPKGRRALWRTHTSAR